MCSLLPPAVQVKSVAPFPVCAWAAFIFTSTWREKAEPEPDRKSKAVSASTNISRMQKLSLRPRFTSPIDKESNYA